MNDRVGAASAAPARDRERLWLAALTLGVWSLAPFGVFQFDDFPNIVLEPSTRELWRGSGLRPLTRLSYFADHALWGMRAHGFLLTNLLLHLGSVLCVYSLAEQPPHRAAPATRALSPPSAAFASAAFFALQPAHAEAVAYASGRATGLMTLLLLAGLVLRARGLKHAGLAACVLACAAKESAVVFPLLIWLHERNARELAKSAVAALAAFAALAWVPRYRELAAWSLAARGPLEALQLNLAVLPEQLSLWLRPWALSVEHAAPVAPGLAQIGAGLALVVAAGVVAFAARRSAPLVSFAIGWSFVALLPTSSFVARADPISERALYLAWVGPALALGDAFARARRRSPRLALAGAGLLLALGAAATFARVRVWSDQRALWADAVEKAPASARAWNNLGMAHLSHDEYERARRAFERALAIDPSHSRARENLHELRIVCGRRCDE
jgi:tetratricopeptide (TPR) repeat protein